MIWERMKKELDFAIQTAKEQGDLAYWDGPNIRHALMDYDGWTFRWRGSQERPYFCGFLVRISI